MWITTIEIQNTIWEIIEIHSLDLFVLKCMGLSGGFLEKVF
jgi:hypothetical protein